MKRGLITALFILLFIVGVILSAPVVQKCMDEGGWMSKGVCYKPSGPDFWPYD